MTFSSARRATAARAPFPGIPGAHHNRIAQEVREQIVEWRREKYAGFNDHHAASGRAEKDQPWARLKKPACCWAVEHKDGHAEAQPHLSRWPARSRESPCLRQQ